jgi:VIT1/CCC1 family predicted Fe2+/Mn2+ transporter
METTECAAPTRKPPGEGMKATSSGWVGWVPHREYHRSGRSGWLRAAVLGADDGIVSIASLLVGVAAANVSQGMVITAGMAGLVAGAMSMATI